MAIAPARLSKREAEIVERLLRVLDSLPENELEPFRKALMGTLDNGHNGRAFMEVLESWELLLEARRDPDYEKNMARGREPLGETFTLDEVKDQFRHKLSGH